MTRSLLSLVKGDLSHFCHSAAVWGLWVAVLGSRAVAVKGRALWPGTGSTGTFSVTATLSPCCGETGTGPILCDVTTKGCPALCSCLIPLLLSLSWAVRYYYNTASSKGYCKVLEDWSEWDFFSLFSFSASCLNMVSLVPHMAAKTWRSTVILTVWDVLNALMHSICFAFCSLASE